MSFRDLEYLLQEAFIGIRRNGVMAFASISTVALSLTVLGAFVLSAMGANNFASAQLDQFQIYVFVNQEAGAERANQVAESMRKMPGVGSVTLLSRDREWETFKRKRSDISSAGLPGNPLPYTIQAQVSDPQRTTFIADKIRAMKDVDKVNEGRDMLGRVIALARVIKVVSVVGIIVLLVTASFIISNAIRLTLYARRMEIRIMQLVGATNEFIRVPLIIEGIVFGCVGGLVAWLMIRVLSTVLAGEVQAIGPFLADFSSRVQPGELSLGMVALGALIGALGSYLSIRRFLRS